MMDEEPLPGRTGAGREGGRSAGLGAVGREGMELEREEEAVEESDPRGCDALSDSDEGAVTAMVGIVLSLAVIVASLAAPCCCPPPSPPSPPPSTAAAAAERAEGCAARSKLSVNDDALPR